MAARLQLSATFRSFQINEQPNKQSESEIFAERFVLDTTPQTLPQTPPPKQYGEDRRSLPA